jgi:uncharacterized membrane protein
MSNLVAVVFDDEATAFEMRAALVKMQKEYLIEIEDAVVVTRDQKGKTKLDQAVNLTTAGAVGGGFWGMLIGLIFLNPLLGAAIGAGAGALSGKLNDIGLNDKMMKDIGQAFKPGTSGLFVLVRRATVDKVLEGLKQFAGKGKVFQTSLNKDDEAALREAIEGACRCTRGTARVSCCRTHLLPEALQPRKDHSHGPRTCRPDGSDACLPA